MSQTNTQHFQGEYVGQIAQVLAASVLSQTHAIVITKPGWGKTDIFLAAARLIAGKGRYNVTKITPSTPPSKITGMYNPREYLEGRQVLMTKNTALDPDNRIVVFDEIGRASEVAYDEMLHVFDLKEEDPLTWPVIWGTANFFPQDERSEALRDRVGLWLHLHPVLSDLEGLIDAFQDINAVLTLAQRLPTWEETELIRTWKAGTQAHEAVKNFIKLVAIEINSGKQGVSLHPRTARQWYNTLYRYNAWLTNDPDFSALLPETKQLMRYMWVQPTSEEWETWGKRVSGVTDFAGSIIRSVMGHVVSEVEKLQNGKEAKDQLVVKAIGIIMQGQTDIKAKVKDDPRATKAIAQLQGMVNQIASHPEKPLASLDL